MDNWRMKRQLTMLLIAALIVGGIGFLIFYKFTPVATCFDSKKNQEETNVDCGGPCTPCALKNPKEISVFWARFVKFNQGSFDVAADIKNLNEFLGASKISYQFELMDKIGAVIALRQGDTFLLPGEETYVIESNLRTSREPAVVNFKITGVEWVFGEFRRPDMIVGERNLEIFGENEKKDTILKTSIQNRSIFDFRIVEIGVLVLDESENLLGAQRSVEKNFLAGEKRSLELSWPGGFGDKPKIIRVEPRVNILDRENILRR